MYVLRLSLLEGLAHVGVRRHEVLGPAPERRHGGDLLEHLDALARAVVHAVRGEDAVACHASLFFLRPHLVELCLRPAHEVVEVGLPSLRDGLLDRLALLSAEDAFPALEDDVEEATNGDIVSAISIILFPIVLEKAMFIHRR